MSEFLTGFALAGFIGLLLGFFFGRRMYEPPWSNDHVQRYRALADRWKVMSRRWEERYREELRRNERAQR